MHIPSAKQLEKWYLAVLGKAQAEGAVSGFDDNTGRHTKLGKGKEQRDARKPDFLFRGSGDSPSTVPPPHRRRPPPPRPPPPRQLRARRRLG